MMKYPKIYAPWNRKQGERLLTPNDWRSDEFRELRYVNWVAPEKVDGMNIQIEWNPDRDKVIFRGRTERAQLPSELASHLCEKFPREKLKEAFGDNPAHIFGEGYGGKIQKGSAYSASQSFIMFDVFVHSHWLLYYHVRDVSQKFDVPHVPLVDITSLDQLIEKVQAGLPSMLREGFAEGVVARPVCGLCDRHGNRIITKIKHRDLYEEPEQATTRAGLAETCTAIQ